MRCASLCACNVFSSSQLPTIYFLTFPLFVDMQHNFFDSSPTIKIAHFHKYGMWTVGTLLLLLKLKTLIIKFIRAQYLHALILCKSFNAIDNVIFQVKMHWLWENVVVVLNIMRNGTTILYHISYIYDMNECLQSI